MLEKIREGSQGVIAKTILVLVILSFAFAGVSSYLGSSSEVPAATVNGQDITKAQFEQAYQNERSRMEQQLGDMFATLATNDNYIANLKKSVLDRLIAETLLDQTAGHLGLRVSDEQIKQAILAEPAFQTDGKFDNERYLSILRQLNYQPVAFSNMMREDMTRQQLVSGIVGSEFVLKDEVDYLAKLQNQTRDIQYKIIDSAPFINDVKLADNEAKRFYDANPAQFMSPEKISLEFVELNATDLAKNEKVTVSEAKAYFDEHKAQYITPEKRLAAHILINFGKDPKAAKVSIDKIYKELLDGADFASLAKKDSDDTLSAKKGGELNWFEQGVMEPDFDKALFAIPATGDISPVIKTNFGYHIIKLMGIEPAKTAPFASVKDKIITQLQEKAAVDEFYQLQQKLADVSYESPDSLDDAAQAVNVKVQTTDLFSRDNAPKKLNVPELIKSAFSDQVMLNGMNSDVIELAPNHVVVIRVKEHKNAGIEPFDAVKANIISQLTLDKANALAKAKADSVAEELRSGKKLELQSITNLSRNDQQVQSAIVNKAFQIPTNKEQAIDTVELAKGYAVVVLNKINPAKSIDPKQLANIKQQLNGQLAQADYVSLIESIKSTAEISYPESE